jgi:hypothetical protein
VSALIYSPTDLVVIQQQKLKLGPLDAIKHISKLHGPGMLMRGFRCEQRVRLSEKSSPGLAR